MSDAASSDDGRSLLLTLAVAVALVVGGVSYASGSAPEWIVLKASAGMLTIGLMGWLVLAIVRGHADAMPAPTGAKLDITLPETTPETVQTEEAPATDEAAE